MRLTDLAIIFAAVMLPIVIIVYVNTSFVVRAEREEIYYKNLITSAVTDATDAMKKVENDDSKIDYGYSGIVDNKISINAQVAVDTFFTSLYNNMGIKGNAGSEEALKSYIPALAVIDYDGIYIYSAEEDNNNNVQYVLKPKKYFTYMYYIEKSSDNYEMKEYTKDSDLSNANGKLVYHVTFTQDDYVYLTVYRRDDDGKLVDILSEGVSYVKAFYLEDRSNNEWIVGNPSDLYSFSGGILSDKLSELIDDVAKKLADKRKEVIAKICMQELSYAVNAHNYYAKKAGIKYNFTFGVESDADWYETVDGVGMVAIVQGISLGNRYLNYSAYSATDLTVAKKYYLSNVMKTSSEDVIPSRLYYHSRSDCPIYKVYLEMLDKSKTDKIIPSFFYDREEAAANGYKPCYICKP